ncbi:MAG TPA: hypothetical protein VM369_12100 [Candidatus Binatia bacterium]|nr:hypothetical protein [Candidatus Binatia bacterium]
MPPRRRGWALVWIALCSPAAAQEPVLAAPVGYTAFALIDAARQRPLPTTIWYPAADGTANAPMSYHRVFRGTAAENAPWRDAAARRPLVLLSHGDKGSNADQCWLAEALARHGYVVAAVSHWKNTWEGYDRVETVRVWERPLDVSALLDALLADPVWGPRIDRDRVGAAGHSSGGYTVLALAGAIYRPLQMRAYCESPQRGPDCDLAKDLPLHEVDFTPANRSYREPRVRAVFAMAPAIGPGLDADSLKAIAVPVDVMAAENDEVLPFALHAARVAREIPGAQLHRLGDGGHFAFMPECTTMTKVATFFMKFDICGRKTPAVRSQLHAQIAHEAVTFFDQALRAPD